VGRASSGKSNLLHNVISALIKNNTSDNLKLILIDPSGAELVCYDGDEHLLTPVITDNKKPVLALKWVFKEIERRKDPVSMLGEKNTPPILVVIDELADLMRSYPREMEEVILNVARRGHLADVHLVISTSDLSTKVISNSLRNLITARVAFQLPSAQESKAIIGTTEAQNLRDAGEMFFQSGTFKYPVYGRVEKISDEFTEKIKKAAASYVSTKDKNIYDSEDENDDLYEAAREETVKAGKVSTSYLQRKLGIGYARSARLVDMLEERGVIGPGVGAKPRKVITTGE